MVTTETMTIIKCPFCDGNFSWVMEPMAVGHSIPPCPKFVKEDAMTFIRNVRLATVGPLPDDAEWPL